MVSLKLYNKLEKYFRNKDEKLFKKVLIDGLNKRYRDTSEKSEGKKDEELISYLISMMQ